MTPRNYYTFSATAAINAGIVFCGDHDDVFIIQMAKTFDLAPRIRRCSWIVAQPGIISSGRSQKLSIGTGAHMMFGL